MEEHIFHIRNYYVRSALDSLRRTALPEDDTKWDAISRVAMLANFAHITTTLFSQRELKFALPDDLAIFVCRVAQSLCHEGAEARANLCNDDHFRRFINEFFQHLQGSDPQMAAAFAAYHLPRGRFFASNNRLLGHAISNYVLMRNGSKLPVYRGSKQQLLIDMATASTQFDTWLELYKSQFDRIPLIEAVVPMEPSDMWHVQASHMLDPRSTIFDADHVLRGGKDGAEAIKQLHYVTGKYTHKLVVFKPHRMALHETVAALVTQVNMDAVKDEVISFIETSPVYTDRILPEASALDAGFQKMADRFREYAMFLVDDHFNVVSPQPKVRSMLLEEKNTIEMRIREKHYDPRSAESRITLQDLVADRLLREYYQALVRDIVDYHFNALLTSNSKLRLTLKTNANRIAWVTIGGPAAGKSSLARLIEAERRSYGESDSFCSVNPDDYRELLLDRSGAALDALFASLTHAEASRITDIIIERLWDMVKDGNDGMAPDMWLDMVSATDKRLALARYGGATVRLYGATCLAEEALNRSFMRARQPGPDKGRYVPTVVVLERHRYATRELPNLLNNEHYMMRMFDTSEDKGHYVSTAKNLPLLIASANGFDKNLEIHETPRFMEFIRKAALNHQAAAMHELYDDTTMRAIMVDAMMEYVNNGIILNFRYPGAFYADKAEVERGLIMLHFAHIEKQRIHIDDLGAFIRLTESLVFTQEFLSRLISISGGKRPHVHIQGSHGAKLIAHDGRPSYSQHKKSNTSEASVLDKLYKQLWHYYD